MKLIADFYADLFLFKRNGVKEFEETNAAGVNIIVQWKEKRKTSFKQYSIKFSF